MSTNPSKAALTSSGRRAVAYYRVSTEKQGRSGLGLEAQVAAVKAWADFSRATIVEERTEVESAKGHVVRVRLDEAIALCKRYKATLVIAKLDRLSRNVAFISALMDGEVEFVACDFPEANRLLLHIMAAVAENEARAISERTKAALAARRARGLPLGAQNEKSRNLRGLSPEKAAQAVTNSVKTRVAARKLDDAQVLARIRELRHGRSLAQVAEALTADGLTTRRDRPWNATQVRRVLARP